jgi:hypothetical protein
VEKVEDRYLQFKETYKKTERAYEELCHAFKERAYNGYTYPDSSKGEKTAANKILNHRVHLSAMESDKDEEARRARTASAAVAAQELRKKRKRFAHLPILSPNKTSYLHAKDFASDSEEEPPADSEVVLK